MSQFLQAKIVASLDLPPNVICNKKFSGEKPCA